MSGSCTTSQQQRSVYRFSRRILFETLLTCPKHHICFSRRPEEEEEEEAIVGTSLLLLFRPLLER